MAATTKQRPAPGTQPGRSTGARGVIMAMGLGAGLVLGSGMLRLLRTGRMARLTRAVGLGPAPTLSERRRGTRQAAKEAAALRPNHDEVMGR